MAIVVRNVVSQNTTAGANAVLNKPTGVISGDVMYGLMMSSFDATSHVTSTGWTEVGFQGHATFGECMTVLRKIAGGSEPSTYSFTSGTVAPWDAVIIALIGVDQVTPEDAAMTSTPSAANSASVVAPTITTVTNNAWWIAAFMTVGFSTETTLSQPAGLSNDAPTFGSGGILMRVDHKIVTPAAPTGTATSTSNAVDGYITISLAIRPSSALPAPIAVQAWSSTFGSPNRSN